MRKQKAFTLVELLVAMAIIGVLLGLAIFGLASAQRAQRDTERRAALQDINIGMQTFYETYQKYPTHFIFTSPAQLSFCANSGCTAVAGVIQKVTVPLKGAATAINSTSESTPSTFFGSTPDAASTNYCLATSIEVDQPTNSGNPDGYVFCAKLENLSVFCVGAGAVKGNIVNGCGITSIN